MNLSRIHRLLKLIGLLQAGRGYNTEALAKACQVSRRTIFRDLELLRESGLPLRFDEVDSRYRIPGPAYLPPLNFTGRRGPFLDRVVPRVGAQPRAAVPRSGRSAAIKIESNLPVQLRDHVRQIAGAMEIHASPANPLNGQAQIYQQLLTAISQRQCARIYYHSLAERQDICTRLSPYRLLFSRRSWYVIGRSSLHRATRTFNVSRISNFELLEDRYCIPRGFSIERHLGNAWHLIPERGPDQDVLIRFSPMVAENVAEVVWHKTQRVKFNEDGSLDFRVTVSGLNEISWWILGYADHAVVIEPAELRQIVARRAVQTASHYRDDAYEKASVVPPPHGWRLPSTLPPQGIQ